MFVNKYGIKYMRNDIVYTEDKFSSLKSHQREAIGLLSIGTFLEYFDLMCATRSC